MPRRGQPNGPDYVQQRPAQNSVPLIDCGQSWCGSEAAHGALDGTDVAVIVKGSARMFCTPGCASRWLIRYELTGSRPAGWSDQVRPLRPAPGDARAWARSVGLPVSDKARVPQAIYDAYAEAHR